MDSETVDDRYVFDAPMYVDFSQPIDIDDNADEWFDRHMEDGTGLEPEFQFGKIAETFQSGEEIVQSENLVMYKDKGQTEVEIIRGAAVAEGAVQSKEFHHAKSIAETENPKDEQDDVFSSCELQIGMKDSEKRNCAEGENNTKQCIPQTRFRSTPGRQPNTQSKTPICSRRSENPKGKTPFKNPTPTRRSETIRPGTSSEAPTRRVTRSMSVRNSRLRVNIEDGIKPAKRPRSNSRTRLTVPSTPTVLKRNFSKAAFCHLKNQEELELEKITQGRQEMEKYLKQSQESYKKIHSSSGYIPVKSNQALTKPEEFKFKTDSRIKSQVAATEPEIRPEDFAKVLRSSDPSPCKSKRPNGPTIPKPFNLTDSRKRKMEPEKFPQNIKTMALQIAEFSSKTPERFRSRPRQEQNKGPLPVKHEKQKMTVPKTPNLTCNRRTRPVTVLSAAEKEELEVKKMKEFKFKAQPVDPRVKHEPHLPERKAKDITAPIGFDLEIERRIKERKEQKEKEESKAKGDVPVLKARPVLHVGVPFKPVLNHKSTEVEAFSFDSRDKNCLARKEAKIQEVYKQEEEARQFKAHPLPDLSRNTFQLEKKAKSTIPKPFSFEERNAKQTERWLQEVRKELQEQKDMASKFKAQPADVLYSKPFIPERSSRPLTDISEFQLNTASRAVEREEYERKKYEMELQKEEALRRQKEMEEEEERLEIARMRSEATHKARPISHFKSVVVKPSDKPLTVPESPAFSDRRRDRLADAEYK